MVAGHKDFLAVLEAGHILFLVQSVHLCVVRANSQLVISIIIEPLFETVALSKFILAVMAHERFLSEGLASGARGFLSYKPKRGRYSFYI